MLKLRLALAASVLTTLFDQPVHAKGAADTDALTDDLSVVLTPTRLRQSLSDVPGSVTVVSADMLAKYAVHSVPEALRLVPGMIVTQVAGSDYKINYHGTNITAPRRMNVLIDGMSVYRSAFARVDWTALPVAIEDIQRIEVTRGPNSASYGPNSMLAIVNIITKHPQATEGTTLGASAGSHGMAEGFARYGGRFGEATSFRMTVQHREDSGLESVTPQQLGAISQRGHDRSHTDTFNFRAVADLGERDSLDLQVAALSGRQDKLKADSFQLTNPDTRLTEYDVSATWRRAISANEELKVQAYVSQHRNNQAWTECLPTLAYLPQMAALWRANPDYVRAIIAGRTPSGGTPNDNALAYQALMSIKLLGRQALQPACGNTNQNYQEDRSDLELQDTHVFSNALRMVAGVGVRRDVADSQTYLHGFVHNTTLRTFANVEYKPSPAVNLNLGAYYERDKLTGASFSPRAAVNTHLDANNTLRFVVSRANRMPDIIEQRANWSYQVSNLTPPLYGSSQATYAQSATAAGNLNAEKILSKEVGYTGNFPQYGLKVDAKIFDDRLTNLISERLILDSFATNNAGDATLRGAELQVDYEPAERWSIHAGYTRLNNRATSTLEQSQYAKNSGNLALTHQLENGWRASFAWYAYQGNPRGQSGYGREDLVIMKTYRLGRDRAITPTLGVSHLDHRSVSYVYDIARSATNTYAGTLQFFANMKIAF